MIFNCHDYMIHEAQNKVRLIHVFIGQFRMFKVSFSFENDLIM